MKVQKGHKGMVKCTGCGQWYHWTDLVAIRGGLYHHPDEIDPKREYHPALGRVRVEIQPH